MSELAQRIAKVDRERKSESMPVEERNALRKTREEAKAAGATLATDGEGGIPASQALGVFRRCEWKCMRCSGQKNLSLHHKAHLDNPSKKMRRLGRRVEKDDPRGLVAICEDCHDSIHNADRANVEGNDASAEE